MNYQKPKCNLKYSSNNSYQFHSNNLHSSFPSKCNNYHSKKILCVFQKASFNEKAIGISHSELNAAEGAIIYTGDYPLYAIDSFELFIANYQPDIVLIHSQPEHKLSQIFSSEAFDNKVKQIPFMNIQHKTMTTLLQEYFQSKLDVSQVCILTKVSEILSSLSSSALSALYTIFNLVLKNEGSSENSVDPIPIIFNRILFNDIVYISTKTQRELKVFDEKLHPSLVKGQGKSKEGVSLFNLFNKCLTPQGKKLLKTFFLFPLQNEERLCQRYDCINAFYQLTNFGFVKSLMAELKNIKDLEVILKDLQKFMVNFKVWKSMFFSISSTLKIFELFKGKHEQFKLLDDLYARINQEKVAKAYSFITNCFEIIKKDIKPTVKQGVNELLDQMKVEYKGIDELLSKYAIEYSKHIPKDSFMEKFMYVFIPQLGYMLAIEKNEKYKSFISKVYIRYCRNELVVDEEVVIDKVKFRLKPFEEGEVNEKREDDNGNNNCVDSEEGMRSTELRQGRRFKDPFESTINNNESIIEEDESYSQPEDHSNNNYAGGYNNNESNNQNIDYGNNNRDVIGDEEEYELHNSEETLMLQAIAFSDLEIQFQFHSHEIVYFKNEQASQLDRDFGDLSAKITDVENAILREVSKQILEYESDILLANDFIANLDVFINLYLLSEKYCLTKPIIANSFSLLPNNNSTTIIKSSFSFEDSRNLLTELTNEGKYIKNSFHSKDKSIFLISGHVSSGKSVFLRMVGMIAYLAQVGCYVPSKVFCFDIFTKILSNIEILESSIDHMSGFTLEIKELKTIVDIITSTFTDDNERDSEVEENLLVLLDDPFKRSSIHNKNCLLAGTIQHLTSLLANNKHKNRKMKLFICLSNDSKDFLIKHDAINYDITLCLETTTITNNGSLMNLFSVKPIADDSNEIEHKRSLTLKGEGCKLLIAKENGLENQLFLRSLEILNAFQSNMKLFPNITQVSKTLQRFILTQADIKKSFNRNSLQLHPNQREGNEAPIEFNEDDLLSKLNQLFI